MMIPEDGAQNPQNAAQLVMPSGSRYVGQPVDRSSRRCIQIVPPDGRTELIADDDAQVTVDHFYHAGTFWRAVIKLDSVTDIRGQAFNFSRPWTRRGPRGPETVYRRDGSPRRRIPILNHVQSRFRFDESQPILLYPLGHRTDGDPASEVCDMVYSLEAVGPPGIRFNLADALQGNLLSAHRFFSTSEMVFERIVVENQYVIESGSLPLTSAQRRAALAKSLLRSHTAGSFETYYLYRCCRTNNCTSNPLQILDSVTPYRLWQRFGTFFYRLPLSPRFYLWVRGLDVDPRVRHLVREEFVEFIRDAETQRRKREFVREQIKLRRAARGG